MKKLEFGDMVTDNYDRTCMVIKEVARPSQRWLDTQEDVTVRLTIDCRWWMLYPNTGGAVHVPETDIHRLGHKMTEDELMEVYKNANEIAKETIVKGMRDLIKKVFKEMQKEMQE